jgi:ethanolamine utilization protein EutQ (cupin superfamily)
MIKVVKASEAKERKVADTYSVFGMLSEEDSKNLSMCLSKAKNHKEIALNTKSDRIYYITKGKVKIKAEGKSLEAGKGDLIFISANTKYEFNGTFEAVQVLSPPFDPANEPLDVDGNPKS